MALKDVLGRLTVFGVTVLYVVLAGFLIWKTADAKQGVKPNISDGVEDSFLPVAAVLGAAFATSLGVKPADGRLTRAGTKGWIERFLEWLNRNATQNKLAALAIVAYFVVGTALCLTYIIRQLESPAPVRTVAIAFAGYAIAYVGKALKDYTG